MIIAISAQADSSSSGPLQEAALSYSVLAVDYDLRADGATLEDAVRGLSDAFCARGTGAGAPSKEGIAPAKSRKRVRDLKRSPILLKRLPIWQGRRLPPTWWRRFYLVHGTRHQRETAGAIERERAAGILVIFRNELIAPLPKQVVQHYVGKGFLVDRGDGVWRFVSPDAEVQMLNEPWPEGDV